MTMLPLFSAKDHHHQHHYGSSAMKWMVQVLILLVVLQLLVIVAVIKMSKTSSSSSSTTTITTNQQQHQRGYVTAITNDNYFPGVIALSQSLKRVKSKVHLYCMITHNVSDKVRLEMAQRNICKEIVVEGIPSPFVNQIQERWADTLTKLRVLQLTQFNVIVFLDADMIVLHNIDHLFNVLNGRGEKLAAVMDCCDHFNSGLMVLKPSRQEFDEIMTGLKSGKITSYDNADQGVFNSYYRNQFLQLPFRYNVDQLHVSHYPHAYDLTKDVSVLHFVHSKPWQEIDESKLFEMEKKEIAKLRKEWLKFRE